MSIKWRIKECTRCGHFNDSFTDSKDGRCVLTPACSLEFSIVYAAKKGRERKLRINPKICSYYYDWAIVHWKRWK